MEASAHRLPSPVNPLKVYDHLLYARALTDIDDGDHNLTRCQGMIVDEGDGCVTGKDWDFDAGVAHTCERVDRISQTRAKDRYLPL